VDIPLLVSHFIAKYNSERRSVRGASPEALKILRRYSWPGNVRELENVVQEAIALGSSDWLRPIDLPENIRHVKKTISATTKGVKPLKEIEREAIIEALQITTGNKKEAARILGIGKTTLYEKIKRYGIKKRTDE
jgi:DNA-binding NtrC family response regulator